MDELRAVRDEAVSCTVACLGRTDERGAVVSQPGPAGEGAGAAGGGPEAAAPPAAGARTVCRLPRRCPAHVWFRATPLYGLIKDQVDR